MLRIEQSRTSVTIQISLKRFHLIWTIFKPVSWKIQLLSRSTLPALLLSRLPWLCGSSVDARKRDLIPILDHRVPSISQRLCSRKLLVFRKVRPLLATTWYRASNSPQHSICWSSRSPNLQKSRLKWLFVDKEFPAVRGCYLYSKSSFYSPQMKSWLRFQGSITFELLNRVQLVICI